ncbi:putative Rossmann fold nucleotide-binding protein [Halapricum desulfuricans]|uniref:Putative Rossmann fold nucleotide-binding protein n=1 Tax=Halapricum desulfuricans TaxID=2841257 RepID=A0A897NR66_9EURY|nr:TIGR00725 family protein [Halapricum desulfuricans]QSG12686.1 putative Rossmann fold nucleotide-binding protein [Halapricum desulfuricans]
MRVSVIGGSSVGEQHYDRAREVGRLLGKRGHEVVCGGLTGVMEATCRGAIEAGGHTIGILPGEDRAAANEYVETTVATGMGNARNALVVLNGDAAVAIEGSTGTLSEIALALDRGLPVAGLDTHGVDGVEAVETPEQAVEYVEREIGRQ